ncbi:MAG: hypothetical protein ACOH2E_01185 [Candidatus Paracaedibacter sp.]
MKLPIILSAMITALAIPGAFAEDAAAGTETAAPETAAAETEKAAPEAKGVKKKAAHHAKGRHHKKHAHHEGDANSPTDPYKDQYGEKLRAADGDVDKDLSPKAGVEVAPGQKTH